MDLLPQLFIPCGDLVELQVFKVNQTPSGIQLPEKNGRDMDDTLETPTALVVSVGPDCKYVKRGDKVLCFGATPATRIKYGGRVTIVLPETKIAAVIKVEVDPSVANLV